MFLSQAWVCKGRAIKEREREGGMGEKERGGRKKRGRKGQRGRKGEEKEEEASM